MAYFELDGYCPSCSNFTDFIGKGNPHQFVDEVHDILKGREQMMVYDPVYTAWGNDPYASITEVLFGGNGVLGLHLAALLQAAIPDPTVVRKIIIRDVICPKMLGDDIYYERIPILGCTGWAFFVNGIHINDAPITYKDYRRLIYDERYVVMVEDPGADEIIISILKLPPVEK